MKNKVSLLRIIRVDVISGVCAMMIFGSFFILTLEVSGLLPMKDEADSKLLFFLFSSIPIYGLPILLRAKYINKLTTQGTEYSATITSFGRGNPADAIWYEYTINSQLFKKWCVAMFYKCNIAKGDTVTVSVDNNNYKRAVIKDLYI